MTISAAEEKRLREIAEREGIDDPDEFVAAARDAEANEEDDGRKQGANEDKADAREAKKDKPDDETQPEAKQESGVKAHGGRGYFSYEYPFLRVNQVLESLFLPSVPDGDLFTGEWLARHGAAPTTDTKPGE